METINLVFKVVKPFGNLFRKKCVLIVVEDNEGQILIGSKANYPPTIARLLGGGVDDGEDLVVAAIRELHEELDVLVDKSDLSELSNFVCDVTDEDGQIFHNETMVFHVKIGAIPYKAGDDVKSILKLSKQELFQLGEQYDMLSDELWYKGREGCFSWADYAKLYGPLHKAIAQKLISLEQK